MYILLMQYIQIIENESQSIHQKIFKKYHEIGGPEKVVIVWDSSKHIEKRRKAGPISPNIVNPQSF